MQGGTPRLESTLSFGRVQHDWHDKMRVLISLVFRFETGSLALGFATVKERSAGLFVVRQQTINEELV